MTIEIRCSPDHFDIRDYAYRDALHKLSQQKGQDLMYAVFNYDKHNQEKYGKKPVYYQGPHGKFNEFDKYKIELKSSLELQHKELSRLSILVPLNIPGLEDLLNSDNSTNELYLLLGEGFTKYEIEQIYLPPVEQQAPGQLCAANAGVALLEYFERRTEGRHCDASRLFLHQVACKLLHIPPTSAPSIRAIVKALTRFGVPPEEFWPYDLNNLEKEPDAFCYAYAKDNRADSYLRLDRPDMDKDALVAQIKIFVYAGFPVICRFSVYDSIEQSIETGEIPIPTFAECFQSDHAVIIVGYDDQKNIVNDNPVGSRDRELLSSRRESDEKIFLNTDRKTETKGAFEIKNSWGKQWGKNGYGWLPYAYLYRNLAADFWSIIKFEWTNTERLGLYANPQSKILICTMNGYPCVGSRDEKQGKSNNEQGGSIPNNIEN